MQDEEKNKKPVTPEKERGTTKKPRPKNEDFKKKYFEFYDDIKISDRQDW